MLSGRKTKYRFPWRAGNRFTIHSDGEEFFPAMLDAVRNARSHVLLEMYLVESGAVTAQFVEVLCTAADAGVAVYLLLDDFGVRGLSRFERQRLAASGVDIAYYNPVRYTKYRRNLFRDHRKLLLVDAEVAFAGGTGLTDEFDRNTLGRRRWHEVMVEVRGPCVADWQALFVGNWREWSRVPLELPAPVYAPDPRNQLGRVACSEIGRPVEVKRSVLNHIHRARKRLWLATAYFIPSWKIRRALRRAARRGVDVRLLLPGPRTDHPAVRYAGRRFYGRLLQQGVRIYEYQPSVLHAKMVLSDTWVAIGSSNIDRWNLRWNLEANQEMDDAEVAQEVDALFRRDFAHSQEIHYEEWQRRPWRPRLMEWFWGTVDVWLERYTRLSELRRALRRPR
jgi:cardiolipin synthase